MNFAPGLMGGCSGLCRWFQRSIIIGMLDIYAGCRRIQMLFQVIQICDSVLFRDDLQLHAVSTAIGTDHLDHGRICRPADKRLFSFALPHMATASAAAEAPSYTDALDASMPVRSQIMV